jgi:beta-glucosidase
MKTSCIIILLGGLFFGCQGKDNNLYKNPKISVDKRVENLLGQMTLDEKLAQMTQNVPENKRLGIPIMYWGECLHGLVKEYATQFPQAIALGSTWEPGLIKKIAGYIALEAREAGVTHCFSPTLDIIRDPRYGRVEECYGEDPLLVSKMGVAFIQGLQGMGTEQFDKNHVLATAKHFAAYSEPQQGINGASVDISNRTLYEIFLPPFEAAVREAKVGSIMPAHQEMNGIPVHMNKWLLTDLLRNEWGFDGFILSDNVDIYRLYGRHLIAKNKEEAGVLAIKAGVDMDIIASNREKFSVYDGGPLKKAVEMDPSIEEYVNQSVGRILKAKFQLGLFETPHILKEKATSLKGSQELALEAAKKSIILLKNDNRLLPLDRKKVKSIAVIGPNAHNDDDGEIRELLGGYSRKPPFFISVFQGIKNKVGPDIKVGYAEGCKLLDNSTEGFSKAEQLARQSDIVIMALGESSATCSEGKDRDNINLIGVQEELLKKICSLGKPVILVLVNGRALTINYAAENVPAILETWYPGMMGGEALADILFGDYNPGAKLTTSIPRTIGQLPVTYLQKPDFTGNGMGQYIRNTDKSPLYAFGYGLSYTSFEFKNLKLGKDTISLNENTIASIEVTNTGKVAGDEVVQLYVTDNYASVARYIKILKNFSRIHLGPGETQKVEFPIGFNELSLLDTDFKKVVEPGDFTIFIGSSSRKDDLQAINLNVISK